MRRQIRCIGSETPIGWYARVNNACPAHLTTQIDLPITTCATFSWLHPRSLQEWSEVQETRMAAIEAYESAKGAKQRMTALTDVLVLCALTLLPPGETTVRRTPPVGRRHNSTSPLSSLGRSRWGHQAVEARLHAQVGAGRGGWRPGRRRLLYRFDRPERPPQGWTCLQMQPPSARDPFTLTVPRPVPF